MPPACVAALALALAACASARNHAASTTLAPSTTTTFHHLATTTSTLPAVDPPASTVAVPTASGPLEGGRVAVPVNAMPRGWAEQFGYREQEFTIHGDARAAVHAGNWSFDGKWLARLTSPRPYTTRLIVRVPTEPKKFSGVVVVEWLDDSADHDDDPVWASTGPGLMRAGDAYVGVSAQESGVDGSGAHTALIFGLKPRPLLTIDPVRYHGLSHPGDDYSYDIFSQAAQALWHPVGVNVLGALRPRMILAAGGSSAATRLVTYYNAVAPHAHVYGGYLVEGRGFGAAPVAGWPVPGAVPLAAHLRTDRPEPVLTVETETDVDDLGFAAARQPDTATVRTWEVAGTAHTDQNVIDYDKASEAVWNPSGVPLDYAATCGRINDGQLRYVMNKAVDSLVSWVDNASPPAPSPRFMMQNGVIERDYVGDAMGGFRTPAIAVPVSSIGGASRGGICAMVGSATRFAPQWVRKFYPTHADYVLRVELAAGNAVRDGFMLPDDAETIIADAKVAPIPD